MMDRGFTSKVVELANVDTFGLKNHKNGHHKDGHFRGCKGWRVSRTRARSGLVDGFFHGIFNLADSLLAFTF